MMRKFSKLVRKIETMQSTNEIAKKKTDGDPEAKTKIVDRKSKQD